MWGGGGDIYYIFRPKIQTFFFLARKIFFFFFEASPQRFKAGGRREKSCWRNKSVEEVQCFRMVYFSASEELVVLSYELG